MRRREFLMTSAAPIGAPSRVWGQAAKAADPAKASRIAIMAYSFVRVLKVPGQPSSPERTLDFFDVPQMFADKYNVHNVEVQHNYFESTETSYLKDFVA